MKIGFLNLLASDEQRSTGVRTAIREIASGLARRGHDVSIITSGKERTCREGNLRVVQVGPTRPFSSWPDIVRPGFVLPRLRYMHRASNWVRRLGLDLLEVSEAGLENLFLTRAKPCAVVTRLHGNISRTIRRTTLSRALEKAEAWLAHHSDAVYSPSSGYANMISEDYQLPRDRIRVIPHGLDLDKLTRNGSEDHAEVRRRWGIGDRKIVLFTGSLTLRKGLPMLSELARYLQTRDDVALVVVGAPEPGRDYSFPDNVILTGELPRSQLGDFYREASVFVMPSRFDNLSMSILEAMAFGLPVVAFDVGGNRDLVHDGVNGFVVDLSNASMLPRLTRRLLDNTDLRDRMGERSEQLVQRFDLDAIVGEVEDFFAGVLASSPQASTDPVSAI